MKLLTVHGTAHAGVQTGGYLRHLQEHVHLIQAH